MKNPAITITIALLATTPCWAQSIERAQLYNGHALHAEAKRECIQIITSDKPDKEKSLSLLPFGFDCIRSEQDWDSFGNMDRPDR